MDQIIELGMANWSWIMFSKSSVYKISKCPRLIACM